MSEKDEAPRKLVALQWDGTTTPRVTAKAEGELAAQIIAMAEEAGIPIQEQPQLLAMLSQLELGEEVPEMLYRAVAEVIAFAYYLSGRSSVLAPTTA